MWDFDDKYRKAIEKIEKVFFAFNANDSGWILDRVDLDSIHIVEYVRNYKQKNCERDQQSDKKTRRDW